MTYERTFTGSTGAPLAPDAGSTIPVDRAFTTTIPVGCPVYTADGEQLGTVKESRGGCFKVDVRMQPDYWLSITSVATVAPDRVITAFTKDRLGDCKVVAPPGA
jgi:hypothetical protein